MWNAAMYSALGYGRNRTEPSQLSSEKTQLVLDFHDCDLLHEAQTFSCQVHEMNTSLFQDKLLNSNEMKNIPIVISKRGPAQLVFCGMKNTLIVIVICIRSC